MKSFSRMSVALVASAAVLGAGTAAAQVDVNPPLPNVMLLIDSSGSMERMADDSMPKICSTNSKMLNDMNRWQTLVTVLTGTVNNRACYKLDRSSKTFLDLYSLDGVKPYDYNYFLPHYHMLSGDCFAGPGNYNKADVFKLGGNGVKFRPWHSTNKNNSCKQPWSQSTDGLMDVYRDTVRFGMMTFDSTTNAGTGLAGSKAADVASGMKGHWSYFLGWQGNGTPAQGYPPDCSISTYEVGARNAAAPSWEGRMFGLGRSDAALKDIRDNNVHIQEALLAMRPYGATPLAALLADAKTFFQDDNSKDPANPQYAFAPAGDPLFGGGCRQSYIILLSDGEPNMDLRPDCEDKGKKKNGKCPFRKPSELARDLYKPSNKKLSVQTFAVGFGLTKASGTDCSKMKIPADLGPGGLCSKTKNKALRACCELHNVAYEGGTKNAFFADDVTSLKSALGAVLSKIAAGSTSRTLPVFAAAAATQASNSPTAPAVAYRFTSSFTPTQGQLWSGNLERHRWTCESDKGVLKPKLQPVKESAGDDFAVNINQGKLLKPRRFMTVVGETKGKGEIDSTGTIRPYLKGGDDGAGTYSGKQQIGTLDALAGIMKGAPGALDLIPMDSMCKGDQMKAQSAADCAYRLMRWNLGGNNGAGLPTRHKNEFGAIYHSTPVLKGAPGGAIRDPAYQRFANERATRPLVLYSMTIDGQLHAHKVASNDPKEKIQLGDKKENNELWSFVPPYALARLKSMYPDTQQFLADGAITVKDVFFERSLGQAKAGSAQNGAEYRTILVASGGRAGGYYFALDVTDPYKPQFLWQLAKTEKGEALFGEEAGAPAIATVVQRDGKQVKEVSVAILPGGTSDVVKGACKSNRESKSFSHIASTYKPRSQVQCWRRGPGRSITVVRLSDGSILRNFRRSHNDGPKSIKNITTAAVDSPFTSAPVPYPNAVGQRANRFYIGDADGTLWRFDMSDPDSAKWKGHIAFDAYSFTGDAYPDGQPIEINPVLSVDGLGNTVIMFATGDQEQFYQSSKGMKTRLWSIYEEPIKVGTRPFRIQHNWVIPFEDGKRVTGPIAVFDKVAYFSTFEPAVVAGAGTCADGYGAIWGVHYRDSQPSGNGPEPLPRLAKDPNAVTPTYVHELKQAAGSVVFGVAVTAEPGCYQASTVNDNYVGSHTEITNSSPPRYMLLYHTGSGGSVSNQGATTKAITRLIPQPRNSTRVDSWAAVAE